MTQGGKNRVLRLLLWPGLLQNLMDLLFPSLALPFEQPCALSRVLSATAAVRQWHWRGIDGQPVPTEKVLSRAGFLPALMAGAVWECHVPVETLRDQLFVGFEEPAPHVFPCGFYLASNPSPNDWAFPIVKHLETHAVGGVVDLEPACSAWAEAMRGTARGLTFRLRLELRPSDAA